MNPTTEQAGQSASAPSFSEQLQKLAESDELPAQVIEQALTLLVREADSLGALLWMSADSAGQDLKPVGRVGEAAAPLLDARSGPRTAMLPALRQAWSLRKRTAIGPGQSNFENTPLHRTTQFLVPVVGRDRVLGLVHLIGSAEMDPKHYREQVQPAEEAAQALGLYLARRQEKVSDQDAVSSREVLRLVRQLMHAETPKAMLSELANYARHQLDAQQAAAVGFVGSRVETTFAEVVEVNRRAVRVRTVQSLAETARQRGVPLTYSRDQALHGDDEPLKPVLHQLFEMTDATAVVLLPLTDGERVPGVLVVEYLQPEQASERAPVQQMLAEDAGPVLARCIDEHRRPLRRTARALTVMRDRPWRALVTTTLVAALVAAVGLGLFWVPVPLNVHVNATLEPRQAATVASPFEGRIDEVLVEPGDPVTAGQPLLRFDSRDWELELAELEAEMGQRRIERDGAMAQGDQAGAREAQMHMERLAYQRQRIERRLERAEVRASIKGVVLSERLSRLEGRDVAAGQGLFEIGDLAQFELELEIPERELPLVERAMRERGEVPVTFLSRAWPELLQDAAVTDQARLLPTSVAESDQAEPTYRMIVPMDLAVSEARLALANPSGRAKLNVGESSVAYRYFRRAWHYLRMQLLF